MAADSFAAKWGVLILAVLLMCLAACEKSEAPSETMRVPAAYAALERSAKAGEAQAQYELGGAFLGRREIPLASKHAGFRQPRDDLEKFPVDEAKAAHWFEKAAAQGHVLAQRELGLLYLPTDLFDPDAYLAQNAKGGWEDSPSAKRSVLDVQPAGVKRDAKTAMSWFAKAAANGDSESQFQLGLAYSAGEGVDKSPQESLAWYGRAAEQGHGGAQNNLAFAYLNGEGVAKDPARAIALLEKAAAQGYLGSAMTLASIYDAGEHVPKDARRAFALYLKAAEAGWADAQIQVGYRYYVGSGVQRDFQKAATWWRRPADGGHAAAQYNLALLYSQGEGVPKDASKAFDLFTKAAVSGNTDAQLSLAQFLCSPKTPQFEPVLCYAWLNVAAVSGNERALKARAFVEQNDLLTKQDLAEAQRLSSVWKLGATMSRMLSGPTDGEERKRNAQIAKAGSGTLFMVSAEGHAITNYHVVNGCKEIRLQGSAGAAAVVTTDTANDLALVKVPEAPTATAPVISDPSKVRQGEEIVAFGFPLNSVLSSGGNLTPGVISALTGLGNNTNQIQITAPVQPGSSGSPVLNMKGEVIGVVSQKISDFALAKATGSVGQTVNFAVNGQTLRGFLDANHVKYRIGAGFLAFGKGTADLADAARQWTRVVECWK